MKLLSYYSMSSIFNQVCESEFKPLSLSKTFLGILYPRIPTFCELWFLVQEKATLVVGRGWERFRDMMREVSSGWEKLDETGRELVRLGNNVKDG